MDVWSMPRAAFSYIVFPNIFASRYVYAMQITIKVRYVQVSFSHTPFHIGTARFSMPNLLSCSYR